MKQAESGLATGAMDVLEDKMRSSVERFMSHFIPATSISNSPSSTHSGPGMTLAFLIKEYGMMIIGLVGNARNG